MHQAKTLMNGISRLYFIGIILVIIGIFLPWWCEGDFIYVCTSGIGTNFSSHLLFTSQEHFIIGVIVATITFLVFQSLDSLKARKLHFIGVSVIILLYFIVSKVLVIENQAGAFVFLLLSLGTGWLIFYQGRFIGYPEMIVIILGSIFVLMSGVQFLMALSQQIKEKDIIGGLSAGPGLVLIFVGALFITTAGIKQRMRIH